MWYIVNILFAQKPSSGSQKVQCESCNVLFNCKSAVKAYAKAKDWAKGHEEDAGFHYVGIRHLWDLGEHQPTDGDEIEGSFFEEDDLWERVEEFIPNLNEIPIIKFEKNPDTPLKDLVSKEKIYHLKKIFKE